jgi:uncharacterized damage-inducible protein DinB
VGIVEVTSAESFLAYYERIRERTLRVAACIPREQLEWRHREDAFSFGDILRHLAGTERFMFCENALLRPTRYPGHGPELAHGYDEVFGYLNRLHGGSVGIIRGLSPIDLQRKCQTPGRAEITVWKWLRSMVEHEIHHRGQIYVFLSMLGIHGPPLYGLTEEEVRARSVE